jgi:hypothetical protein
MSDLTDVVVERSRSAEMKHATMKAEGGDAPSINNDFYNAI